MELKFITYARKSREDDKAQILSIQSQIDELHEFAHKNSLPVKRTLEESQSAHKTGRPIFDQLMNLVEAGQANALLVWKFDRISRNAIDTARVIEAFNKGLLQEIRSPFEVYKAGENILLLYLFFGLSDQYSQQLSSNVKRGNRMKLKLGQYPGKAPFGYINYNRNNVKNIEPDDNSRTVKMIFELYGTDNYSLSQIKNKLNNDLKILSKRGLKFSKSELQKIIKNKVYFGVIERAGELYEGTFEPIISKELYDKANNIMSSKSRPRGKKSQHPYKLMINCTECGSKFTAGTKHKYYKSTDRHAYYTYYFCSKKKGYCSQKPIKEKDIEGQFIDDLGKYEFDKTEWDLAVDLLILDQDKKNDFSNSLISKYQTEVAKLEKKLLALIDLRAGNEITKEEHTLKRNEYLAELKGFKSKINELGGVKETGIERLSNFAEIIMKSKEILESDDILPKRQLLQSISLNLFILDGKLNISFKKPFNFFFNKEKQNKPSTMSGREDLNLRPHGPKPRALAN